MSRKPRRGRSESKWADALAKWARPELPLKARVRRRLAAEAFDRGLPIDSLCDLAEFWTETRSEPLPTELHAIEELLVA